MAGVLRFASAARSRILLPAGGAAPDWRRALAALARRDRRGRATPALDDPRQAWIRRPGVGAQWSLDDARLLDRAAGRFTPERMLAEQVARFGQPDWVLLWSGYPRLGLDARDQVALWADQPGGVAGVAELVAWLRRQGIRVLLPWLPWDALAGDDGEARMLALLRRCRVDGVLLDTLDSASPAFLAAARRQGWALVPEHHPGAAGVGLHAAALAQEQNGDGTPWVHRHRWSDPRHQVILLQRWEADRWRTLANAWLNGCSVLIWEDVFGSWNPWSAADATRIGWMGAQWRRAAATIAAGWRPFADVPAPLRAARWGRSGELWTVVNDSDCSVVAEFAAADPAVVAHGCRRLGSGRARRIELPPRALAALAPEGLLAPVDPVDAPPPRPWRAVLQTPRPALRRPAAGMAAIPAGRHPVVARFLRRECGDVEPYQHGPIEAGRPTRTRIRRSILATAGFSIQAQPVSRGDYARFLAETGWRPRHAHAFLRDWAGRRRPLPALARMPVAWVDLDDARAYADWAGMRLPTDAEWSVAVARGAIAPAGVWEWTESEHRDAVGSWCLLVGGPAFRAAEATGASGWYFPGGPGDHRRRARLPLAWAGLDRAATIGFRLVVDHPSGARP